ncbi:hypothetical protein [Streptomyces axinellae]|uniref:Secreted protein n=1 Tax=Streptomyces axinellae TaxID=552788 RepID=A0ABP6D6M9_9ACTN
MAGSAALALMGLAGTAHAESGSAGPTATLQAAAGSTTWYPDGGKLVICDNAADGWSVVVDARVGGATKYTWHTSGAGKCTERSYRGLPEGATVNFRVCSGDYSENLIQWDTCGGWVYSRA